MTESEVKRYLRRVRLYDAHIDNKLEELARLRELSTKITSTMQSDGGGGSDTHDKVGEAVAKIIDLEREINEAVDKFINLKKEINDIIVNIADPDQLQVLYKRYIQYKHWEEIACEMHFSYRNVCYIHGRALQRVAEVIREMKNETTQEK